MSIIEPSNLSENQSKTGMKLLQGKTGYRFLSGFWPERACCCRDVFNEKPTTELLQTEETEEDNPEALPRGAVIHTSRGDISLKLFPAECPRTVENFTTHGRNGYYNNVIFHRVIKGFCIQTGDPLGELEICLASSIFRVTSVRQGTLISITGRIRNLLLSKAFLQMCMPFQNTGCAHLACIKHAEWYDSGNCNYTD